MHKETKYVLFLDDDVRLHPGTIGALVACIEENPKVTFPIADEMQVFSFEFVSMGGC